MRVTLFLIAVFYSFGCGMVMAQDTKTYNGSYCSAIDGNQNSSVFKGQNGLRNMGSQPIRISCPIIEDSVSVLTGTQFVRVHYTGPDTVYCTLLSLNGNGTVLQMFFENRVGTGWMAFNPQISIDDFWGTYSMICTLPAQGTLNTIWFRERT